MQDGHQLAVPQHGGAQQVAHPHQLPAEALDDDFLVAQQLLHQQHEALATHLQQQQGEVALARLQVAEPEHFGQGPERQYFSVHAHRGPVFQVLHRARRQPQATLHRQCRNREDPLGIAHDHGAEGGQTERQVQVEAGALAGTGLHLDAPAEALHRLLHDGHAQAATGEVGDDLAGGQPRREDQLAGFGIGKALGLLRAEQAAGHRPGLEPLQVEAGAVVADPQLEAVRRFLDQLQ
ncbi:hypothetical protein FQZ97_584960 [compost metagenome]